MAQYEKARAAWAAFAERAAAIYRADVAYGRTPFRRGHWSDRLAGIDQRHRGGEGGGRQTRRPGARRRAGDGGADGQAGAASVAVVHTAPERFHPGAELVLTLKAAADLTAILHYRHVDQAERWTSMPMTGSGGSFTAVIPATYTRRLFRCNIILNSAAATRPGAHPAFNASLSNTPYYAVFKRG